LTAVEPFAIEVADEVLDDLHRRLDATRWFDPLAGAGWDEGTDLDYLKELCRYWRHDFDWRAVEAQLNQFPQYTTVIDNQRLHFIHTRSRNPGAMALVIHHGWPGSVTEFAKVIEPLRERFHVVCPSLPGYRFPGDGTSPLRHWAEYWYNIVRWTDMPRGGHFASLEAPEFYTADVVEFFDSLR